MFKVPAVSLNCLEIPRYHQLPLLIHNYPMDTLNKIFNALHQIAFRDTIGTVGLNVKETLKKCSHKLNIFLIPVSISELTTSQNFFVTVWPPGGAIITFAENWNFELN